MCDILCPVCEARCPPVCDALHQQHEQFQLDTVLQQSPGSLQAHLHFSSLPAHSETGAAFQLDTVLQQSCSSLAVSKVDCSFCSSFLARVVTMAYGGFTVVWGYAVLVRPRGHPQITTYVHLCIRQIFTGPKPIKNSLSMSMCIRHLAANRPMRPVLWAKSGPHRSSATVSLPLHLPLNGLKPFCELCLFCCITTMFYVLPVPNPNPNPSMPMHQTGSCHHTSSPKEPPHQHFTCYSVSNPD